MFDNSKEVSKELLIEKIGEAQIFKRYLGLGEINEGELILNPLRNDSNPTASFKWVAAKTNGTTGRIQFRDWSEGFSRDCFNIAQLVTREPTFYDTLIRIAKDFGLLKKDGTEHEIPILENVKRIREEAVKLEIKVLFKDWEKIDIDFWKQFGISVEQCKKFYIYPIRRAWIGERLEPFYEWTKFDIGYAFYFGNGDYKLYFPMREKFRFIHNNSKILQGYWQLPKIGSHCVIQKSLKDVVASDTFGVIAVAPMSETVMITEGQYKELSSRFLQLFILNDNDWPGRRATVRTVKQYSDIQPLLFEQGEPKDLTDNVKKYGVEDMRQMVESLKIKLL